ncbi:MAG: hypothetical protein ACOVPA_00870 [Rubrivivax sp.]
MTKISDYLAQLRRMDEQRRATTVAEFAAELDRPVDTLLSQFRAAGVSLEGVDSSVSEGDKQALLSHLRGTHTPTEGGRKRIRIETRAERSYRAVAGAENGAEWDVLQEFASEVVWEQPIDPLLQRLVNLIVAKAVLVGSLPPARRGRPVAEDAQQFGRDLAEDFWAMRDSGVPYKDAIGELSARHHKDERHLSRIIKEHTRWVGETRDKRDRQRQMWSWIAEVLAKHGPNPYRNSLMAAIETPPLPELSLDDYLDHLSELLERARPNGD